MIYFFYQPSRQFFFHLDEEKKGDQLVASFVGSHELQLLLRLEIISSGVLTFSAANEKRINFFLASNVFLCQT